MFARSLLRRCAASGPITTTTTTTAFRCTSIRAFSTPVVPEPVSAPAAAVVPPLASAAPVSSPASTSDNATTASDASSTSTTLEPETDLSKGHAARIASILKPQQAPSRRDAGAAAAAVAPSQAPSQTPKEKRRNVELTLTEAFVNNIMKDGKKARARRTLLDALQHIQRETGGQDPHVVLQQAVAKVSPLVKIVTTKRGAKGIQTPTPLNERQRRRFGILWIVDAAAGTKVGTTFGQRIGAEVLAIMDDKSTALLKRTNLHKQALSNRSNILMADRKMRRSF
ncbi:hypothetical protein HKX48_007073 [Thoreauomyces humboldtii]|nr:hypothetical protein HKX48_007073 [Thoreauomyces humboldtii]